jgi:hypothetical protein
MYVTYYNGRMDELDASLRCYYRLCILILLGVCTSRASLEGPPINKCHIQISLLEIAHPKK